MLLTTKARLHYAHQRWELDGTYLLFFNPHLPYAMEMLAAQETEYPFKGELIRTYLQLAIHEALQLQSAKTFVRHHNAATRLAPCSWICWSSSFR